MKALLGPVTCQGCALSVAWFRTYWSDDAGASVHRCHNRRDFAMPCVCGGSVIVRDGDIPAGVRSHQARMVHIRWRRAMEFVA